MFADIRCAARWARGYLIGHGYGFSYQNTASMPEGWYVLTPAPKQLQRGTIVLFHVDNHWRHYLRQHHWIQKDDQLMKHVAAVPGDYVCVRDHTVYINNKSIAKQALTYKPGKPLPQWHYCAFVSAHHYLLLSTYNAHSFDGRYFGLVDRGAITARAIPIWTTH